MLTAKSSLDVNIVHNIGQISPPFYFKEQACFSLLKRSVNTIFLVPRWDFFGDSDR